MVFDGLKWYKRTGLLYAVGTWTLLGSCGYYAFYNSDPQAGLSKVEEEEEEEKDPPSNMKIIKSSHMTSQITYKERFVPYSRRILEFFRPRSDDTSGSRNEEK